MLLLLTEAALRTLVLGMIVASAFKLTRRQGGRAEMTAWIAVLSVSLAMPLLMQWSPDLTVTVPHAVRAPAEFMLRAPDAPAAMDVDTDMDEPAAPGAAL